MQWESYSHPISDVRDWNDSYRLELRPDFQRNEVWSNAAQIMLIDTIIKGIPIPKVYIKSIIRDGNTYRVVIDGQQRLTAILKFVKNKLALKKPYIGEHQDKKFSELPPEVQNQILRYKIDINEIFNPTDEEIRDLYSRVNKYTVQLNKQELRRADFPGDFIHLAEELSENKFFEKAKIFSVKQRRRMLDVEYIEELLTIILKGIQDKKDYLDAVCEEYMQLDNQADIVDIFTGIIDDIALIFDAEEFPMKDTRFKQKSDFYSLFACIFELRKEAVLNCENLERTREILREMCDNIGPQSDDDLYREYATRCLSDANSISNREWRVDFLKERLSPAYGKKAEYDDIS
ncbi:hypothetical protein CE91St43_21290 [Oscillospiraceae bacterium]|nr:hypothetical protein CE91St43_21290 [Oscillospiraceae bacterium]